MAISPSLPALRRAFYGGNLDSGERAFLEAAYAANIHANDLIALVSGSNQAVTSVDFDSIVQLTQAAYNALSPPNARTLYVIVG